MKREYGGCLPLEINKLNTDYFPGFDYVALNSGRSAIAYGVLAGGFKRVYIPYYTCKTVEASLLGPECEKAGVEIVYYNIDEDFAPIMPESGWDQTALFVYTNYFGIMTKSMEEQILKDHQHVLFDNTQGFFTEPVHEAYSAYSCRKFFGVADGAYLVADELPRLDIPMGHSADTASFLLKAVEDGPNAAYEMSKENEEHINGEGMCTMSPLTEALMSAVDLSSVNDRRLANFNRLHALLGDKNLLDIHIENGAPMVYPLLVETEGMREYLVDNNIFVPRWWRWITDSDDTNDFEKKLSKYLVPIPVTQNYDLEDMEYIAGKVLEKLK
ncbi:MAG: hypothetical protein K5773_08115 [Pseudobutyrivibrio sp.]|nr:hypothetical protein [Pseudobutyrivibrio sp.]